MRYGFPNSASRVYAIKSYMYYHRVTLTTCAERIGVSIKTLSNATDKDSTLAPEIIERIDSFFHRQSEIEKKKA